MSIEKESLFLQVMNKQHIKQLYQRFKQWQKEPFDYKMPLDEQQHCNNCGYDFTGNYCPRCSQRAGISGIGWSSVRQSVMEVWGLGSRSMPLTVWQLLLRPGYIINDYINGKRQVSFPPVKMLFVLTVIYSFLRYWLLPDVLGVNIEEDTEELNKINEIYQWYRKHYSWAMLILSSLAILPTWVMFRYSPRNTRHTLPEGFFIQVFFMSIMIAYEIILLPLEVIIGSSILENVLLVIIACYYLVGYIQLFGYKAWGTLWRQCFVLFVGIFSLIILLLVGFPNTFQQLDGTSSASPQAQHVGYEAAVVFFFLFPLILLAVGYAINRIATRKSRRQLREATK